MRTSRRLAWAMWGASIAFLIAFLSLVWVQVPGGILEFGRDPFTFLYAVIMGSLSTIGLMISTRHSRNSIGWLFLTAGLLGAVGFAAQLYADRALFASPGWAPAGEYAAWISIWTLPNALFIAPMLLLFLFPSGGPGSGRRKSVFKIALVLLAFGEITLFFQQNMDPYTGVRNPILSGGTAGDAIRQIEGISQIGLLIVFLTGIVFLVTRFRASRGIERQQMKLFAYPAGLMGALFAVSFAFSTLGARGASDLFFVLGLFMLFAIPIASTIAILRYRLYDIDLVINRTLVYGSLTALLAGTYVGVVALLQVVLEPVTAQNDLAIVVSTLVVAAVSRPLRTRVQIFIDRRFYRNRYDSAATLENFAARLRDEIDLGSLSTELVTVVGQTMQPQHASLWLMEGGS